MKLLNFTISLMLFALTLLAQQDAHYWTHQYGAQGLLLNGAVIANTEGETALFYNPGAVGMAESQGFELSFVTPTYSQLKTSNLLGDDNQIIDRNIDYGSGFIGVTFKPKDYLTVGVTTFQRYKTDISFTDRVLAPVNEGNALLFRGDLDFSRRISEHWIGFNAAFTINENLGIGLTQFSTFHGQSTNLNLKKEILSTNDPEELKQSWRTEFGHGQSAYLAWITKLGAAFRSDQFRVGLTYTSPSYGSLRNTGWYYFEDQRINILTDQYTTMSNRNDGVATTRKSPASYGLGVDVIIDDATYSLSTEYFSSIRNYVSLSEVDDPFDGNTNLDLSTSIEIQEANRSVLNIAIGYQKILSESTTFILGFRTDFDPGNQVIINEFPEYLGSVGNVYHLSGGGMFSTGKNNFSLGIDIGYGRNPGGQQLADLSEFSEVNLFVLEGDDTVTSTFSSIMIFFTYDFIFSSFN